MGKAQRGKRQAGLDPESTPASQTKAKPENKWLDYLICGLLIVGILAVYWRVTGFALTNFDDEVYVTENDHLRLGLTGEGIRWALTATIAGNWHPLTLMSYLLNYQIGHLNPQGYHLLNLLLHIANSLLLFLVLHKMTGFRWRSAFVAALFAIHPVHVESVAWVAERKDVLSTLFWILTIWAYVSYTKRPGIKGYLLVVLAFALGLMSKPMLVTLPLVLLLLDFWPLGRFSNYRKLLLEKAPLLGLSAASSVITYIVQQRGGSVGELEVYPMGERIANAVVSYMSYIGKTFWPQKLAAFYPYPSDSLPPWQVIGAALLLVCITYLAIRMARRCPYVAVGWLWYVITLVPVIGIVQVGKQAMADRYTYVTLIGIFIAIAWGIPELLRKADANARRYQHSQVLVSGAAGIAILALMYCAYIQVGYWRNSITLFRHALRVTTNNFVANLGLGSALWSRGYSNEAIGYYRQALRIEPGSPEALSNMGLALANIGKAEEALKYLYKALEIKPDDPNTLNNIGLALAGIGKAEEGLKCLYKALEMKPNDPNVNNTLGFILCGLGRFDEGEAYFKKALQINPRHEKALLNYIKELNCRATRLAQQGNLAAALKIFFEALRLDPQIAETHYNLGMALGILGETDEAIKHYLEAVRLKPNYAEAHNNLGVLYAKKNNLDEAIRHFAEAVRIDPNFRAARSNLEKFSALKRAKQ